VKLVGTNMTLFGSLVFVVSLAVLPYAEVGTQTETLWDGTTRFPVILTIVAALAGALAFASVFADVVILPVLAMGLSFWLLGQFFPTYAAKYTFFGIGFWLCTAAALTASVGGIVTLVGSRFASSGSLQPAGSPPPPMVAPITASQPPAAPVPAGWYADPSQPGRRRYWSGVEWTEQVQQ
jgi:hypothetical protein